MPAESHVVFETESKHVAGLGVSVIVTLYNYEQYIENALQSILRQTHQNLELIIIDDTSTDGSVSVAIKWLKENSDILADLD